MMMEKTPEVLCRYCKVPVPSVPHKAAWHADGRWRNQYVEQPEVCRACRRSRARRLAGPNPLQCELCSTTVSVEYARVIELDHIIPRSSGGPDEPWNTQWICCTCHQMKTVDDARGLAVRAWSWWGDNPPPWFESADPQMVLPGFEDPDVMTHPPGLVEDGGPHHPEPA